MLERLKERIPPRLRRSAATYQDEQLGDRAAALTYYAMLSLFPGLALLISILGLLGTQGTVNGLLDVVDQLGPSSAVNTLRPPIDQIVDRPHGAGLATVLTGAATLWTASGYLTAYRRAAEKVRGVEESPSVLIMRPLQLAFTLGIVLLAALVLSALLLTGPLADAVADVVGLGNIALTIWSLAKWPGLVLAILALIVGLYWSGRAEDRPPLIELLPGAALAAALWIAASGGFALYIAHFGSYDATYGSLGAVIIFLIWLWLTNAAILLGMVYNESAAR